MSSFSYITEAAFHAQQMARGVSADYRVSTATTIESLTIVPAETVRDNVGADGVIISNRIQDWLIKVSDLDGNEPKRSHKITVGTEVFELLDLDDEKPFRFHNPPSNSIYRIHTVLTTGDPG